MTDLTTQLNNLRRPRLLVRAARHGLNEYDRKRDLRRVAGRDGAIGSSRLIKSLIAQEEEIEATRLDRCATYSVSRHIEVLVALMAESRNAPEAPTPLTRRRARA